LIIFVVVAEGYHRDDRDSVLEQGRSSASLLQVSGPTPTAMKIECNIIKGQTPGNGSKVYVGQAKDTGSMVHGMV
jgi:hypothetical protein